MFTCNARYLCSKVKGSNVFPGYELFKKGSIFSLSLLCGCEDGAPSVLREEVKMENGRSPVLGCSLSVSEGAELMEGAAAAAAGGKTENLSAVRVSPHSASQTPRLSWKR